jgi:hypothetical protein
MSENKSVNENCKAAASKEEKSGEGIYFDAVKKLKSDNLKNNGKDKEMNNCGDGDYSTVFMTF